jgi:SAM-dependent methyltransferase
MSLRCTTDRYDALYARWLTNPGALLDLAGYQPGQRLLDLCGGSGVVSIEALRRGADANDILLLDWNPYRCGNRLVAIGVNVNQMGSFFTVPEKYDIVVCRQAIAYLDLKPSLVRGIFDCLAPGGKFVFNTFREPRWSLKMYKFAGRRYFEASGFRVQASPTVGFDVTRFHWYTEEDLRARLGTVFNVQVTDVGTRSQHWVCTLKALDPDKTTSEDTNLA